MIIGKFRTNADPKSLIFNGQCVEFVKEWRYLGFDLVPKPTLLQEALFLFTEHPIAL